MQVQVIFPLFDNDQSDNSGKIEHAIRTFCGLFGGATVIEGNGHWVNPEGRLYSEPVAVVMAYATEQSDAWGEVRMLARELLDLSDQEAVFVSVGGKAEIID